MSSGRVPCRPDRGGTTSSKRDAVPPPRTVAARSGRSGTITWSRYPSLRYYELLAETIRDRISVRIVSLGPAIHSAGPHFSGPVSPACVRWSKRFSPFFNLGRSGRPLISALGDGNGGWSNTRRHARRPSKHQGNFGNCCKILARCQRALKRRWSMTLGFNPCRRTFSPVPTAPTAPAPTAVIPMPISRRGSRGRPVFLIAKC
jgi:hypothetical protein